MQGLSILKAAKVLPEPELALVVARGGQLVGYSVGNDMRSRDIEGASPLYLPQAKVYAAAPPGTKRGEERCDGSKY